MLGAPRNGCPLSVWWISKVFNLGRKKQSEGAYRLSAKEEYLAIAFHHVSWCIKVIIITLFFLLIPLLFLLPVFSLSITQKRYARRTRDIVTIVTIVASTKFDPTSAVGLRRGRWKRRRNGRRRRGTSIGTCSIHGNIRTIKRGG